MGRNSATVLALGDYRTKHRTVYFTRFELNQLLGLYSRHVSRGVWRDYAIDHRDGMALFSVFRHTHEAPAYRIVKTAPGPARPVEFYRANRAAAPPRLREPRRCAGFLSDAPNPGKHKNRLTRTTYRQHLLDDPSPLMTVASAEPSPAHRVCNVVVGKRSARHGAAGRPRICQ